MTIARNDSYLITITRRPEIASYPRIDAHKSLQSVYDTATGNVNSDVRLQIL